MKKSYAMILAAAAILISCSKANLEVQIATQNEKIESYVNKQLESNHAFSVVRKGTVVRLITVPGQGEDSLAADGLVKFNYAAYDFSSFNINASAMLATNDSSIAISSNWKITDSTRFRPVVERLSESGFVSGLKIGLEGVKAGEECFIIFNGEYGFGNPQGTIPANAPLAYHIWVHDIENK